MDEDHLIITAASNCDLDALRVLVSTHKSTLLHRLLDLMLSGDLCLSEEQIVSIFTMLRDAGVDPNAMDEEGRSALSAFLQDYENRHVPRLLVEVMGADPNKAEVRDECLEYALSDKDDSHAFDLLLELGCRPPLDGRYTRLLFFNGEKERDFYEHMLERLLDMGLIRADERDNEQDTPLHCALMELEVPFCHFDRLTQRDTDEADTQLANALAALLLARGADPLALNQRGETPLDVWNQRWEHNHDTTDDVQERLLNARADALDRLDAAKFDAFVRAAGEQILGKHICDEIIKPLVLVPHPRGPMAERRTQLAAMLDAEGIAPDGYYYENCLRGAAEIDMREFRLRHIIATAGAPEYDRIVRRLRRQNGGRYFPGIHANARAQFKESIHRRGVRLEDQPPVYILPPGEEAVSSSSSEEEDEEEEEEEDEDSDEDDNF
jgi:hypothetical protein